MTWFFERQHRFIAVSDTSCHFANFSANHCCKIPRGHTSRCVIGIVRVRRHLGLLNEHTRPNLRTTVVSSQSATDFIPVVYDDIDTVT